MSSKGKHSPPGAGNIYAKANEVIVKITGADTNQTFEVVEENCKPGFQSRAHYHIKAYETFYVFEGSADFQVGDEMFHAAKGSCVHIPPGVPHQVTSPEGVRMLMIYSPRRHGGHVCRHARAVAGRVDEARAHQPHRSRTRHRDDREAEGWTREGDDIGLTRGQPPTRPFALCNCDTAARPLGFTARQRPSETRSSTA